MKRFVVAVVVVVLATAPPVAAADITRTKPNCGRSCQKANDRWITDFTDYFVNDSDGGKDSVFTVYHRVPIGEKRCDIVKTYEDAGVDIEVVCP